MSVILDILDSLYLFWNSSSRFSATLIVDIPFEYMHTTRSSIAISLYYPHKKGCPEFIVPVSWTMRSWIFPYPGLMSLSNYPFLWRYFSFRNAWISHFMRDSINSSLSILQSYISFYQVLPLFIASSVVPEGNLFFFMKFLHDLGIVLVLVLEENHGKLLWKCWKKLICYNCPSSFTAGRIYC